MPIKGVNIGVQLPGLRAVREQRLLSQRALEDLSGVSRTTILAAEQGKHISRTNARKLAEALKVDPLRLLGQPEEVLAHA